MQIVKKVPGSSRASPELVCGICLVAIKENAVKLDCKGEHMFHRKCIMTWLHRENQCPHCRQPPTRMISICDSVEEDLLNGVLFEWEDIYRDMGVHFNSFMRYTGDTKKQWIKRIEDSFREVLGYVEAFYRV